MEWKLICERQCVGYLADVGGLPAEGLVVEFMGQSYRVLWWRLRDGESLMVSWPARTHRAEAVVFLELLPVAAAPDPG